MKQAPLRKWPHRESVPHGENVPQRKRPTTEKASRMLFPFLNYLICSPESRGALQGTLFNTSTPKPWSSLWIRHHRHWKNGFDYYIQRFTPILADVTVTNPSPSRLPLSSSSQMYTPLYVAKKAEARKNSRYLATARAMNHLFHPYAVETFGSCGPVLDNTLKALADRFRNMTTLVSNSEVSEKSQRARFWRVKYL